MQNTRYIGHIAALITIATWGTTFISTKVLLTGFQPLEILFFRFIMAFFALWLAYPKMLKTDKKQDLFLWQQAFAVSASTTFWKTSP